MKIHFHRARRERRGATPNRRKLKARKRRWFRKLQADPRRRAARNEYMREKMAARRAAKSAIPPELQAATDSTISAGQLRNPTYLWIDPGGRLHVENEISAEELIRRWKEAHE